MRGHAVVRMIAVAVATFAVALTSQAAPAPGGHDQMLSRLIRDAVEGHIQYETMTPGLADAVRPQAEIARSELAALGALKSVTLESVDPTGAEFYRTDFEHGALEWAFSVDSRGLIANAKYRRPPPNPS